ncbi:hypothetical protein F5051DRAFT_477956 [Lentinula edodes]|nr:hypothetical protein F5051DRAFT_477956 [Lentinula edodes]
MDVDVVDITGKLTGFEFGTWFPCLDISFGFPGSQMVVGRRFVATGDPSSPVRPLEGAGIHRTIFVFVPLPYKLLELESPVFRHGIPDVQAQRRSFIQEVRIVDLGSWENREFGSICFGFGPLVKGGDVFEEEGRYDVVWSRFTGADSSCPTTVELRIRKSYCGKLHILLPQRNQHLTGEEEEYRSISKLEFHVVSEEPPPVRTLERAGVEGVGGQQRLVAFAGGGEEAEGKPGFVIAFVPLFSTSAGSYPGLGVAATGGGGG